MTLLTHALLVCWLLWWYMPNHTLQGYRDPASIFYRESETQHFLDSFVDQGVCEKERDRHEVGLWNSALASDNAKDVLLANETYFVCLPAGKKPLASLFKEVRP